MGLGALKKVSLNKHMNAQINSIEMKKLKIKQPTRENILEYLND